MIKLLCLKNFRNYKDLQLEFDSRINIFTGKNGQGKTNILESIFFLSILRSFRTSQIIKIKTIGAGGFYVGSVFSDENGNDKKIEAEYYDKRRLKIDNVPVQKSSEFINQFNAVVFSPSDILLVNGVSSLRRKFLDMFITTINPSYLPILHDYHTAVLKRNAFLKEAYGRKVDMTAIKAFEPLIAVTGSKIIRYRNDILLLLSKVTNRIITAIKDDKKEFNIKYISQKGMEEEGNYLHKLEIERNKDILKRYTSLGPHTDDFDFVLDNKSLKDFGSTGQCRLASICLKLASLEIIKGERYLNRKIVALVDDVTGELDFETKQSFYGIIKEADQLFFTFTEKCEHENYLKDADFFKVEDGIIRKN